MSLVCQVNFYAIHPPLSLASSFRSGGFLANILLKSEAEYEVILIDATETPIERPQKNRENIILERKKAYIENAVGYRQKNVENNLH